jgi:hypothetical protein
VVDDQKRHGVAIAMPRRHFTVEGFGALIQPLPGCGEKGDVVLRGRQDIARVVRGKTDFPQHFSDLGIVPEFAGEDAGHTICVRCRTHGLFQLGKAFRRPASEYCHGASRQNPS